MGRNITNEYLLNHSVSYSVLYGFQPLTIITKHSILDVAATLDPSLLTPDSLNSQNLLSLTKDFCRCSLMIGAGDGVGGVFPTSFDDSRILGSMSIK